MQIPTHPQSKSHITQFATSAHRPIWRLATGKAIWRLNHFKFRIENNARTLEINNVSNYESVTATGRVGPQAPRNTRLTNYCP